MDFSSRLGRQAAAAGLWAEFSGRRGASREELAAAPDAPQPSPIGEQEVTPAQRFSWHYRVAVPAAIGAGLAVPAGLGLGAYSGAASARAERLANTLAKHRIAYSALGGGIMAAGLGAGVGVAHHLARGARLRHERQRYAEKSAGVVSDHSRLIGALVGGAALGGIGVAQQYAGARPGFTGESRQALVYRQALEKMRANLARGGVDPDSVTGLKRLRQRWMQLKYEDALRASNRPFVHSLVGAIPYVPLGALVGAGIGEEMLG